MYIHTGDTGIIHNNWPAMNRYMDYLRNHERSRYLAPDQDTTGYGDWIAFQGTGYEVMADYCYGYVVMLMRDMADIICDYDKSEFYGNYFNGLKEMFYRTHVTYNKNKETKQLTIKLGMGSPVMQDKGGIYEDNSQTALLWLLKLGYYKNDDIYEEAVKLLVENIKNENPENSGVRAGYSINSLSVGVLGVNVIAPVLTEAGYSSVAYDLLLNTECPSWLYEVKNGATTIWERWDSYSIKNGFGDSEMNSFNHFSYGSIAEWMYCYMAGISAGREGFKHIVLQPVPDTGTQYNEEERISKVNAVYESCYGQIKSCWTAEGGRLLSYKATIPANTTASIYLPEEGCLVETKIPSDIIKYIGETMHNKRKVMHFEAVSDSYEFMVSDLKKLEII